MIHLHFNGLYINLDNIEELDIDDSDYLREVSEIDTDTNEEYSIVEEF